MWMFVGIAGKGVVSVYLGLRGKWEGFYFRLFSNSLGMRMFSSKLILWCGI